MFRLYSKSIVKLTVINVKYWSYIGYKDTSVTLHLYGASSEDSFALTPQYVVNIVNKNGRFTDCFDRKTYVWF